MMSKRRRLYREPGWGGTKTKTAKGFGALRGWLMPADRLPIRRHHLEIIYHHFGSRKESI
jgi:hypothetical protein